jgi:hypothetical protein
LLEKIWLTVKFGLSDGRMDGWIHPNEQHFFHVIPHIRVNKNYLRSF